MNCADAVARLSAALDGELSDGEAGDVRRHLDRMRGMCPSLRTLQQVREAVRATPFAPVDASRFDARVHERVGHDVRSTRISGAWVAAAAALVISVSSAVLMLQDHAGSTPRVPVATAVLPSDLGGWPGLNEGRAGLAMDCGLSEASSCVIDAPPGLMAGN